MDALAHRVHIPRSGAIGQELEAFANKAQTVARPKALYRVGYIDAKGDDWVDINGTRFTSRVLRVNLEEAHRVFAYVATCGAELQDWASALGDPLQQYWSNVVQEMALRAASKALNADIAARYQPGRTSAMAPGSLGEWPLFEQRPLFSVLGDTMQAVGVRLSESLLMIPTKSVSGVRFPTEQRFESCLLCPRADCPGRRAPYDEGLYDKKYRYDKGE